MFWWVLEPLERLWLKFFLVGPESPKWRNSSKGHANNIEMKTAANHAVCFVILMNLIILTCVLWKTGSNADLQRFTRRLQYRYVPLTLDKHHLPGAAATQEAPVLLLQLQLQSAGHVS